MQNETKTGSETITSTRKWLEDAVAGDDETVRKALVEAHDLIFAPQEVKDGES